MTLLLTLSEAKSKTIEETINDYFVGYMKANVSLIKKAFHEDTRLLSIENKQIDKTEMIDWLRSLEVRNQRGDVRTGRLEVLSIDVTDFAAIAKIRIRVATTEFTDYLSLLKVGDEWKIVGKIYYYKSIKR